MWTQLANNTWIYFAPHSDIITIFCHDKNPVDVSLKRVGKLQVQPGCKGYGTVAILSGSSSDGNISTHINGDLLSKVTLQYDCCEELGIQVNLSKLTVDLTYRKTVSHLDDLKYASKKESDLLEDVREQEWRNNHVVYHDTHSVLLFFIVSVVSIYLLYKLYTCTRHWTIVWYCKKEIPATPADVSCTAGPGDLGSTFNINIKNSNDSLNVTDAISLSPKRALGPRVAKSYF
jgi:hypothetical protein